MKVKHIVYSIVEKDVDLQTWIKFGNANFMTLHSSKKTVIGSSAARRTKHLYTQVWDPILGLFTKVNLNFRLGPTAVRGKIGRAG